LPPILIGNNGSEPRARTLHRKEGGVKKSGCAMGIVGVGSERIADQRPRLGHQGRKSSYLPTLKNLEWNLRKGGDYPRLDQTPAHSHLAVFRELHRGLAGSGLATAFPLGRRPQRIDTGRMRNPGDESFPLSVDGLGGTLHGGKSSQLRYLSPRVAGAAQPEHLWGAVCGRWIIRVMALARCAEVEGDWGPNAHP